MRAEDDEVRALIFGHLDQGPAGRRVLDDAELHFRNALEKLGGLASEGVANRDRSSGAYRAQVARIGAWCIGHAQ